MQSEDDKDAGKKEPEREETALAQTLEGEEGDPEKRQGDSIVASRHVNSSRMTQALDEVKSETMSKRSSV